MLIAAGAKKIRAEPFDAVTLELERLCLPKAYVGRTSWNQATMPQAKSFTPTTLYRQG